MTIQEKVHGRRCQVCTGCGLCPGVSRERPEGLKILTKDLLKDEGMTLHSEDGLRLIAADIGTTTIAMELYEANGSVADRYACVNPQTQFGADVLSRITAAEDPQVKKQMTEMVRSALARGAERFLKCLGEGETAVCVIAANTVMSYLLMGWDPRELGQAPFKASRLSGAHFTLGLTGDTQGTGLSCLLVPGFSAFVGGDLFAGAIACKMTEGKEMTLLVDLGTNGEILLGNEEEILATATAAGPAFEGGPSKGIFGADLVKFAARLLDEKILDETGLLAEAYFEKGVRIGNVTLTKESVRSLQLAKAAIRAGIEILVREKDISMEEIDRVILGGGFGYFLNPADAVRIGLLPKVLEKKTYAGGNTSLAGAKRIGGRMLTKEHWRGEGKTEDCQGGGEGVLTQFLGGTQVKVINLASRPEFESAYLEAMAFRE